MRFERDDDVQVISYSTYKLILNDNFIILLMFIYVV